MLIRAGKARSARGNIYEQNIFILGVFSSGLLKFFTNKGVASTYYRSRVTD